MYKQRKYPTKHLLTHLRGTPPLPRPRSARCAVPGGALGPALGYNTFAEQ